jgi:CRP-like cAMP-binding protein/rhodanese-related sulfurtransferase
MNDQTSLIKILSNFLPLADLKLENLAALAKKTEIKKLELGETLFKEGDREKRTYYLVAGSLRMSKKDGDSKVLEADGKLSKNPLAPILPRHYTATAASAVEYFSIDSELLDVMLTWDQTGHYEVSDLQDDDTGTADWMTSLLQTKTFQRIPPGNIQAIFMRMQKVNLSAGDVVIKQGEEGDFFYVITKGSCTVTRETPLNEEGIKLAELQMGDTFGEESLISEAKRNATVTMMSDGGVMRLGKEDFKKLLNEPMINWVDYEKAKVLVANGGLWIDVRLPSEFEAFHEEGAVNIPLYFIRMKLNSLDPEKRYVLCCDTGRRSSAGTFILNENGFDTCVLRGGLNGNQLKTE